MYYLAFAWVIVFILNTGLAQIVADPNFNDSIVFRTSKMRMSLLFAITPIFFLFMFGLVLVIGGDTLYKWAKWRLGY